MISVLWFLSSEFHNRKMKHLIILTGGPVTFYWANWPEMELIPLINNCGIPLLNSPILFHVLLLLSFILPGSIPKESRKSPTYRHHHFQRVLFYLFCFTGWFYLSFFVNASYTSQRVKLKRRRGGKRKEERGQGGETPSWLSSLPPFLPPLIFNSDIFFLTMLTVG